MNKKAKLTASIVTVVVIAVITVVGTVLAAKIKRNEKIEQLTALNHQQNELMIAYIDENVKNLIEFSNDDIIKERLLNQTDDNIKAQAQKYTEDFSKNIAEVDGAWIGTPETEVLAHTNSQCVGLVVRKADDVRKPYIDAIVDAGDDACNMGIMIGAQGRAYANAYKGIYDSSGKFIGFTGLGVKTDELYRSMKELGGSGLMVIDVDKDVCLFSDNNDLVGENVADEQIIALCKELKGSTDKDGTYKLGDKLVVYSYFADWKILVINEMN